MHAHMATSTLAIDRLMSDHDHHHRHPVIIRIHSVVSQHQLVHEVTCQQRAKVTYHAVLGLANRAHNVVATSRHLSHNALYSPALEILSLQLIGKSTGRVQT